jgi:acetyl esterase
LSDETGLTPDLFAPEAVDAETAAFNARLEATLATVPSPHTLPIAVTRAARESGKGISGPLILSDMATERTIPGPGGAIPLRVFVPETVRGVYLYIHGGGWTLWRAHHQDPRMEAIARACNVAVVSVDYRLAPEHPYPAAPDDCEAAARWLIAHARREFGTERIVIGGFSAGAHLSVVTLLRLRDTQGYTGMLGANLEAGVYDLSLTPSVRRWGGRFLVLSTPIMEWFAANFVPEERRREPDVSPLYADLSGLPPALFTVGTLDPLVDDSLFMHARWIAAGNASELAIYPGGVHGFNDMPLGLAERANARIDAFIRRAIGEGA